MAQPSSVNPVNNFRTVWQSCVIDCDSYLSRGARLPPSAFPLVPHLLSPGEPRFHSWSWRTVNHSVLTFYAHGWGHPPNHSPQASSDSGWSKGWTHASGRLFLYVGWERSVFGGWKCSPPVGCLGSHFRIPKEGAHRHSELTHRGSRAQDAE